MIAGAFICGPNGADDCWLTHKLRVLSACCDAVFVLLDRSPGSELICRLFPKVQVRHYEGETLPPAHDGNRCSEGVMRQAVWDWASESDPRWIVLGDADEFPAPSIVPLLADMPAVDCLYADWPNLIRDAGHAIGGLKSEWSYQKPGVNKKGLIVRHVRGRRYRYRAANQHVRIEPNPLAEAATVFDRTHRLGPVPLLHYRWAAWDRWLASDRSKGAYYAGWPPGESVAVPGEWRWKWDADDLIRSLPEPIAVVGNGPCVGKGAEIDAAASVVRMNNWVADGYGPHVGTRCDLWITNVWDDVLHRPWTGSMLAIHTEAEQPARVLRWLGAYPHMHVPAVSWIAAARKWKRTVPCNPSTGLTLLSRLKELRKRFVVYGFDGLATGHYWDAAHRHNHGPEVEALRALRLCAR